jgi:small-conductance mechanosensitive channel
MIELLEQALGFLGPYAGYVTALVILVIALFSAKIASYMLGKLKRKVAKRTETGLDDIVIHTVKRPLQIGIILLGLYFAIGYIPVLAAYTAEIAMAFTIIFSFYIAFIASSVVAAVIDWYSMEVATKTKTKRDEQFLPIIKKAAYGIIFGIMILVMFGQLGIRVETLIAAMGIGGLAVALALSPTLSNFFSGVHMVLDRPLKIGDFVELDSGDRGTVMDIGWRSTRIQTFTNNILVIPNEKLADSRIINYSSPTPEMGFIVDCGVAYDSDLDKVEKIALEVAKDVQNKYEGVKGFEPLFRYQEFADSAITFRVIMRVKTRADSFLAKHAYIKALKKRFDKEKITIPFPQRDVHMDKLK